MSALNSLPMRTQFFRSQDPLPLQCGETLPELTLAFETHGQLNERRDNAILLFHALTGSHHAAGWMPPFPEANGMWNEDCETGWWSNYIGPGKALDTNKFFIVCANYLGGCYGSTGPLSENPSTNRQWGASFPSVTLGDIVESQIRLLDHLQIQRLHSVIGPSCGGLLSLTLATTHPDRVATVIPIASSLTTSALQRMNILEQICAIELDPHFNEGKYNTNSQPTQGLALARMISHKTFISPEALGNRTRNTVNPPPGRTRWHKIKTPEESYMLHQGHRFVERFDANSYLRLIEAWQQWDLVTESSAENMHEALARLKQHRFLVYSISSDVCFQPKQQEDLASSLSQAGATVTRITVHSDKGHDAFLVEPQQFTPHLSAALSTPAMTSR